jgi:hypothetical protein
MVFGKFDLGFQLGRKLVRHERDVFDSSEADLVRHGFYVARFRQCVGS